MQGNISQQVTEPRFEFRTFGQNLETASHRMARFSIPVPEAMWERFTEEWYVISKDNDQYNIKIRSDALEVKKLLHKINGLEQWKPIITQSFPVPAFYIGPLFELSSVEIPDLEHRPYDQDELFIMIKQHEHLQLVSARKQRFAYIVNDTKCETAIVLINGAKLFTISSESEKMEDVIHTLEDTGLIGVENINYLEAIKRVTGISSKNIIN